MQHLISKLDSVGMGVVVHNGSTLFSGDAGSAESNIRKWMLDSDIVEAVIQLPTDEFFNTGIYTYLWILNKNKTAAQKNKVMLINASEKFTPLKKTKGSKRKEVDEASRQDIVSTLTKYKDNDYARVFDKEFFYFNKQAIMLTNVDEQGRSFEQHLPMKKNRLGEMKQLSSLALMPVAITQGDLKISEFRVTEFDEDKYPSLVEFFENDIKPTVAKLDFKGQPLVIHTADAKYYFDAEQSTLIKESDGKKDELGCGKIIVSAGYKKATNKLPERIEIIAELTADHERDYEFIGFNEDPKVNKMEIEAFMAKHISKPFQYLENVIGVELNFNKIFYEMEKLRGLEEIASEITALDNQLKALESRLSL